MSTIATMWKSQIQTSPSIDLTSTQPPSPSPRGTADRPTSPNFHDVNLQENTRKLSSRNGSTPAAAEAAKIQHVRKRSELQRLTKANRRKIVWCLLLTATLLVIAIGFFAATACVGLKTIMESDPAAPGVRFEDSASGDTQSSLNPNSNFTSYRTILHDTSRNFRTNTSTGWMEAARNILSSIDFDADPCEDFYQYACGVWPLKNPLGPEQSTRTVYTTVTRRVSAEIRKAIEDLGSGYRRVPDSQRVVKTVYDACVDSEQMTKDGAKAMLRFLHDPSNGIGMWPIITSIIDPRYRRSEGQVSDHSDQSVRRRRSSDSDLTTQSIEESTEHENQSTSVPPLDSVVSETTTISTTPTTALSTSTSTTTTTSPTTSPPSTPSTLPPDPSTLLRDHIPDFTRTIGNLKHLYGIDTVIFTYVGADDTKSGSNVLQLSSFMLPLGLGLFKAPYYLNESKYGRFMRAYTELITTTANLLLRDAGFVNATINRTDAEEIVEFERRLAAHMHKADSNFHRKWTVLKLIKEIPMFDWNVFLETLLPRETHALIDDDNLKLDVPSKRFLLNAVSLLNRTDPVVVQNYLIWRLVKYSLPYLGHEYREALQKLNTVMNGAKKPTPVSETCIDYVQGRYDMPGLGYTTGRIFVEKTFSADAKRDVERMVESIVHSFQSTIRNLNWMDEKTKTAAIDKSNKLSTNAAYPEWIMNDHLLDDYYSNLIIHPNDSMFEINVKLRGWSVTKNQLQLLDSGDRQDFGGPPSATNAWYNVGNNALTVPAGELQPPFYKLDYPLAVKYGAVGSVIGHELMHGFDAQGSRYDARGRLHRLWSDEAMDEFEDRTRCLQNQYDNFCYPELGEKTCVDGEHTIGENTADLGGVKVAYGAYRALIDDTQQSSEYERQSMPGPAGYFSADQMFFLSFASFWCGSSTEQAIRDQLITNHHTPAMYRVIGTLRNVPEFANAFQCPNGSRMNPRDKCEIW